MRLLPLFSLTLWNGFILIIPMLLFRFLVPYIINPKSLPKLQYFPEVIGKEKIALKIYMITVNLLMFSPLISPIRTNTNIFVYGLSIYCLGLLFNLLSVVSFSKDDNFVCIGIYKLSRNPMYIGYFGIFLGMAIMIDSVLHIVLTIVYQVCTHFLILSEERWCREKFGRSYEEYFKKVPRYLLFK